MRQPAKWGARVLCCISVACVITLLAAIRAEDVDPDKEAEKSAGTEPEVTKKDAPIDKKKAKAKTPPIVDVVTPKPLAVPPPVKAGIPPRVMRGKVDIPDPASSMFNCVVDARQENWCEIVMAAENSSMMFVVDDQGKFMDRVRGVRVTVPPRSFAWVELLMYDGLYEPPEPEIEIRRVRRMYSVPFEDFKTMLAEAQRKVATE